MYSTLIEQYEDLGRVIRVPWSGCWLWIGAVTKKGYGMITGNRYAHRLAYEEFIGPIPTGMQVLHKCDVKCCVNPEHLYSGTHRDNVFDAVIRDRYTRDTLTTHCHRGHEFTESNTYHYHGHRHCKSCWKLKYKNS